MLVTGLAELLQILDMLGMLCLAADVPEMHLTCEQITSLCKACIADTCMPTNNQRAVRLSLCRRQVRHFARFVDKVLTKFPHDVLI